MATTYPLAGKVALVTRAAKGIGYETARQMHARGASVAVLDLERADAESAADSIGERTLALDADVTDGGRALRVELAPHGASAGVAYFGFIDTDMVRAAFADPVAQRVEAAFPAWLTKRLTPELAGATIVNGIERRAPRMIAPRWWGAWSALRGVVNPFFDRYSERDDEIADAIRHGERNPS